MGCVSGGAVVVAVVAVAAAVERAVEASAWVVLAERPARRARNT